MQDAFTFRKHTENTFFNIYNLQKPKIYFPIAWHYFVTLELQLIILLTWICLHFSFLMKCYQIHLQQEINQILLKIYFFKISQLSCIQKHFIRKLKYKQIQVNKMMSCNSSQVINAADKCHKIVPGNCFQLNAEKNKFP